MEKLPPDPELLLAGSTSAEEMKQHDPTLRVDHGEMPPGTGKPAGRSPDGEPVIRGSTSIADMRKHDQTVRCDSGELPAG